MLAAILEYLTTEIFEAAVAIADNKKRNRIIPQYINMSIKGDEELNRFFRNVTIAGGGVLPNVHDELLTKAQRMSAQKAIESASLQNANLTF